ncbi:ABC transporter permease [Rhodobacteraceae bacterium RKSG542]|uniref:ABC transporter permease n=1 Tax=Pseudovibrio flavus TaxID=2529854 RepID=UPI0012BD78F5|nr:ABC transporter permease [Pseudovibrio flavus]MTI15763.1 ABC transporter permease [Pseudovibrio flavus]
MTSQDISATSSSNAPLSAPTNPVALLRKLANVPGVLAAVTFALVLVVWETSTHVFAIPSFVLPAPTRILAGFDAVTTGRWLEHVWATLRIALFGYFLSIAFAVPIAVALARSPMLSKALYPILVVIQSTPVVAIAPIVIVVLGAGDAPRIVITCLITFFPIVVSTTTGLMATPPELIELSRSLKATAFREISQIRLPFAVPYIFSALKISITLAVIGAVVAEFVAAEKGIGYFIQFSTSLFKIQQAWSGLVVLVVLSLVLFQMVSFVQRLFFPWSLSKDGR